MNGQIRFVTGLNGGHVFDYKSKDAMIDRLDFLYWWIEFINTYDRMFCMSIQWRRELLESEVELSCLEDYTGRKEHRLFPHGSVFNVM